MKKLLVLGIAAGATLTACNGGSSETSYKGIYHGVSYRDEATRRDRVEVVMELDKDSTILSVDFNFFNGNDRLRDTDYISAEFVPETDAATSAFDIDANDMMSTWAAHYDGTSFHVAIMSAWHRIMVETTFDLTDATAKIDTLTWTGNSTHYGSLKNGATAGDVAVFTTPTEGQISHPFVERWSVASRQGIFKDMNGNTTVEALAKALFGGTLPTEEKTEAGFHSNGGWAGNYLAMSEYLKGKKASEYTSLTHGIEVPGKSEDDIKTASTNIIDSSNMIAGATMRTSRENQAYQKALVAAGILKEDDVFEAKW